MLWQRWTASMLGHWEITHALEWIHKSMQGSAECVQ